MKASDFRYERPVDLTTALALMANDSDEMQALAGGQSLMSMMNFRLAQPDALIDLNGIEELRFIRDGSDCIEIGAMTRYAALEQSALIEKHIPLFTMALPHIAHAAIRNRGTIGGSAALADPAAEMPALLKALDATLVVAATGGERRIAADDFFLGLYDTALHEGELIKSISVPKAGTDSRFGFYELARRHGDYAMAGVAIAAKEVDPFDDLRIVMFSVGDHALRVQAAEEALQGKRFDDEDAMANALAGIAGLDYQGDLNASSDMKKHLAQVVFKRALEGMRS